MELLSNRLHPIFRIACAMCFIGHGAFGIITKQIWCNYFGVFGIGEALACKLMPLIGMADIILGIILIVYPVRAVAGWLVFWGLFTASLRPLSGEPFAEFLERAGNFGAPVVLLLLSMAPREKGIGWFQRLRPEKAITEDRLEVVQRLLQVFGFLLLLGHGWLNLLGKHSLLNQYTAVGFENPSNIAGTVGVFECMGAVLILVWPSRMIILLLLIWKIASEVFYPAYPVLEWIERGGSYAVLLGLWIILGHRRYSSSNSFLFL